MAERSIVDYLETACALTNVANDRKLAELIGVTPDIVDAWRSGQVWPSEEQMFALAALIGVPRKRAFADLNAWRSAAPEPEEYAEVVDDLGLLGRLGNAGQGMWLDQKTHEMAIRMAKPGELVIGSTIVPKRTADELRACYKFKTRMVPKPAI